MLFASTTRGATLRRLTATRCMRAIAVIRRYSVHQHLAARFALSPERYARKALEKHLRQPRAHPPFLLTPQWETIIRMGPPRCAFSDTKTEKSTGGITKRRSNLTAASDEFPMISRLSSLFARTRWIHATLVPEILSSLARPTKRPRETKTFRVRKKKKEKGREKKRRGYERGTRTKRAVYRVAQTLRNFTRHQWRVSHKRWPITVKAFRGGLEVQYELSS